jgi:hypothetical protein
MGVGQTGHPLRGYHLPIAFKQHAELTYHKIDKSQTPKLEISNVGSLTAKQSN